MADFDYDKNKIIAPGSNPVSDENMRAMAQTIHDAVGQGNGFALFVFGFKTHQMRYISTGNREDVLRAVEQWIRKERGVQVQ